MTFFLPVINVITAAGAWTPADLGADLLAWYKADAGAYIDAGTTLATNGQTVAQWNDQSGNGYHLSGTGTQKPTYLSAGFNSLPTLSFDNNTKAMATAVDAMNFGSSSPQFSAFVVGQMLTATSSNGAVLSFISSTSSAGADWNSSDAMRTICRSGTSNSIATYWFSGARIPAAISLATNYRLGLIFNGTNLTNYINNVVGATAAHAVALDQNLRLTVGGTASNSPNFYGPSWDGPVSEIVIVKAALNSTERADLDGYFTAKWGL